MTRRWALGIDVGGSGSRAALSDGVTTFTLAGSRAHVAAQGSSIPDVAAGLVREASARWPDEWADLGGIAIGATGAATLVADPIAAVETLAALNPGVPLALATDAVTTHLGALGGEAGAIVAVGTGAIGFSTDLRETWHRVDGWGHLLGDRGAGAWIGIEGLRASMLAHDAVDDTGTRLLAAARARFGAPHTWPGQLYTRQDRAGVLAGFAPDVAAVASGGDPVATSIMARAGAHVADTLAATVVPGIPPVASTSGGVFAAGGAFVESFRARFSAQRPEVDLREPRGSSLDGAVLLARRLGSPDAIPARDEHVWISGRRRP